MNELDIRAEVNNFLGDHPVTSRCDSWMRCFDPDFSRALGERGWLGMTIPPQYGGQDCSYLERFVVTEELLRVGAPVAAHWIADRQIAPMLMKFGTETLRSELLPGICRGEVYFSIAISESDAGSDVAAVSMRAERRGDEWVLNGRKMWTTGAHVAHYVFVLARSSRGSGPYTGLTQFVVPMDAPGLTVRPIEDLSGEAHFNELHFENVVVNTDMVVGDIDGAWVQILAQLDYERTGPERVLSTYPFFEALSRWAGQSPNQSVFQVIGRLAAWYACLRSLSRSAAVAIDAGQLSAPLAATVKLLGTHLEQIVSEAASVMRSEIDPDQESDSLMALAAQAQLYAPTFTLRGGTSEILRTIIARRLLSLRS